MWLTTTSIRRPVFILMIVSALIVLGLNSCGKMKVEQNPKVDFPFVSVQTIYPGAGPEEIESQVTKKIEDAVASVNGLKTITSSSQEGRSAVNLEFNLGTATDVAAADIREKVSGIRALLPIGAKDPVVAKFDNNAQPIIYYGLTGNRPPRELRDLGDNYIKPRLGKINGVGAVNVTGGRVREINVAVRKERLDAYGVSILQLSQLINLNNVNFPAGRIEEGKREYSVRVVGEFANVDVIRKTRLRMPNGQTVQLSDIADVQDTTEERQDSSRMDGTDSVAIIVQKTADGNTIEVAQGVKKEIAKLQTELPRDVKFVVNQDSSIQVESSIEDVKVSIFLGAALAVLVVFLFLHNIRGTFIVAIAIPTSIFATFLPMFAMGFSLNGMTLLALSLSVGILVDDSIVVLENIYRHLKKGDSPEQAAINGRSEIGLAAITITLVDVVVFLPIAFMGGISGMFFKSFGVTVAVATLFSLFMSFTLTPMLASRWYRAGEGEEHTSGIFGLINRFYTRLDHLYRSILSVALKYRGIVVYVSTSLLVLVFLTVAASFAGASMKASLPKLAVYFAVFGIIFTWRYRLVGLAFTAATTACVFLAFAIGAGAGRPLLLVRFAPDQDQSTVQIIGEMPVGTSFEHTEGVVKNIEKTVLTVPDVRNSFVMLGATQGGFGIGNVGPQYFSFSIRLKDKLSLLQNILPWESKEGLRKRTDQAVAADIRDRIGQVAGASIKVSAVTGFQAGGAPLQIDILGNNIGELSTIAQEVLKIFKDTPGVVNADTSSRIGKPEQRIIVDRDKAASLGLNVAGISAALRNSLEGDETGIYRENGNEYKIRVHFAKADRTDTNEISDIVVGNVATANGGMSPVRAGDVASVKLATGPTKIDRMNRQKLVSVTANLTPGTAPGNLQKAIGDRLAGVQFGNNTWSWGGENKVQNEESSYMGAALGLAIILVYMLMAALFNNLLTPAVIMVSLPQAIVGALLGLMISGHALTVVAMIGIIMLIGLVTKNAILLVDYTNTLRERGIERTEAILEAGPTRLRPILMTTIAMVIGMLPTALGLGRGAEFRAPLATPVIGGLILSTMLTLIVIPCTYTYFDDLNQLLGRIRRFVFSSRKGAEISPAVMK